MLRRLLLLCLASFVLAGTVQADPAQQLLADASKSINTRYLLIGPDGQAVSDQDFAGRFQLIAFGYTYCPDICPTTLVDMAELLKQLGPEAERVQGIFISLDPERDTPRVLQTYTRFFDARILGLSGTPELVQRAARNYKVRYAKVVLPGKDAQNYAVDHSAGLYLLDPGGQFLKKFPYGRPVGEILGELRNFLRDAESAR